MDWKKLLADLAAAGWTQAQIGSELGGKAQSWVADVARGKYADLKWADGERLRKLHRKVMRRTTGKREVAHA